MLVEHKKKKRKVKPFSSVTYTTGDIKANIDHFNKMLNGSVKNNSTGYLSGTFKNDEAEKACAEVGTFASQSPDGANSISLGGENSMGTDSAAVSEALDKKVVIAFDCPECGYSWEETFDDDYFEDEEDLEAVLNDSTNECPACGCEDCFAKESEFLTEAGGKKGRKVTRYFVRPQKAWLSRKIDILQFLTDHADEDCVIYTLVNLEDNKDITKLNTKDVIYFYEDGVLYDKNHVRIMDYDLAVKKEEERKVLDVEHASDDQIEKVYSDRIIGDDTIKEDFDENKEYDLNKFEDNEVLNQEFNDINAYGEKVDNLKEGKEQKYTCCICGEEVEGYGNNPEPYKHEGKCCDACNLKFVIPARLELLDKE